MNRLLLTVAGSTALLIVSLSSAHACSCVDPLSVAEALEYRDLIFLGKVQSVTQDGEMNAVLFEVSRVWKGEADAQVEVLTSAWSASCGYSFQIQNEYLVYSTLVRGKPHTGLCSRTKPASEAAADIAELDALTPARALTWGRLKLGLP